MSRRLQVVLDTNQWDAHTLLRSHLSASLVFLVEQHDGRIVVPGVVGHEVVGHLVVAYTSALAEIRNSLSRVRMILGHAPDPDFAPQEAVDASFQARLDELGPLVEVGDVLERHHIEAGRMVLAGLAPNSRGSQQFKDCLLWRAIVDLFPRGDVLFVTADNGFYTDKNTDELHSDLQSEVPPGCSIILRRSMQAAVSYLQSSAPVLDLQPIMAGLDRWLRPQLEDLAERQLGLQPGRWTAWDAQAFVTGKPNEAVVSFTLRHELVDPSDENLETVGDATSSGEVVAALGSGEIKAVDLSKISFTKLGEEPRGGLTVLRPDSAYIGTRILRHELRVAAPAHLTGMD